MARKSNPSAPVITKAGEVASAAAVIRDVLSHRPMPENKPQPDSPQRMLGYQDNGDYLPMDPPATTPEEQSWIDARNSMSCELGILLEPQGAHGWLTVKPKSGNLSPILLMRLPLLHSAVDGNPF